MAFVKIDDILYSDAFAAPPEIQASRLSAARGLATANGENAFARAIGKTRAPRHHLVVTDEAAAYLGVFPSLGHPGIRSPAARSPLARLR